MQNQSQSELKPLRIGASAPLVPLLEVVELADIIGRVVPGDLLAALEGRRGAALRIVGEAS